MSRKPGRTSRSRTPTDKETSTAENTAAEDTSAETDVLPNGNESRLITYVDLILSMKNLVICGVIVVFFAVALTLYALINAGVLHITDRPRALFAFTSVLILLYSSVLFASIWYRINLREVHADIFESHKKRAAASAVPRFFSVYILPVISIALVVAAQVATLDKSSDQTANNLSVTIQSPSPLSETKDEGGKPNVGQASRTPSSAPSQAKLAKEKNYIPYMLAFTFSTSAVLLMIGMELAYTAQEHPGHSWSVLVTASLILDFISYLILVVGLEKPGKTVEIEIIQIWFTFLLGLASLVSSYYTIAQARMTDEVLNAPAETRSN